MTVDARLARSLPLPGRTRAQIIVETFNLLNRGNTNGVQQIYYAVDLRTLTVTPNPRFGSPLASAGGRIVQLAAKLTF